MKILLLGATGPTGLWLISRSLDRGHEVTALVRRPEKLTLTHPNLTIKGGDALDAPAVRDALEGQEAVVSALGQPFSMVRHLISRPVVTIYSYSARLIIGEMEKAGVSRFIGVTSVGTNHEPDPSFSLAAKIFYENGLKRLIKQEYDDMRRMEVIVQASQLDWTLIRPPQLTNEPPTGKFRVGLDYDLPGGFKLSRTDLAGFMLDQLSDPQYIRKTVSVGY